MKGPGGRGEVEVAVSGVAGKKPLYAWDFQNFRWHLTCYDLLPYRISVLQDLRK